METFSIKESLKFGWNTFKSRPWFFAGSTAFIVIAYELVNAVANGTTSAISETSPVLGFLLLIPCLAVIYTLYSMGVMWFSITAHDHPQSVKLADFWHPQPFWNYLAVYVLVTVAVLAGLILLIVPGIIASLMFMFAQYIVLEKGVKPIDAMKESMRITKGRRWKLLGLLVVFTLLNIAGALALLVGLLITMPVTMIALVHVYRYLSRTEMKAEPTPAPELPAVSSTVLS